MNATPPLGPLGRMYNVCSLMLIFSEEILFIFLLIDTEFLGFELLVVMLLTIQIKSAVFCAAEALQLAELLVISFVIGS